MKIAMVSTHDRRGGAARAALRLHQGLIELGSDSVLYCRWKSSSLSTVREIAGEIPVWRRLGISAKSFIQRLPVKAYTIGPNCDLFSVPSGPFNDLPRELKTADIINLHWVSSMVDVPRFMASIEPLQKVVWTLHDMNAFTGGCHYSGPCDKFVVGCHRCPELNSSRDNDLAERSFKLKKEVLDRLPAHQIVVVTPSRWLQKCAASSLLLGRFRSLCIPYGVDTQRYSPSCSFAARRHFNISEDAKVVLFVADRIDNYRKGIDLLLDALNKIPASIPITLIALGRGDSNLGKGLPSHVSLKLLGFVSDEVLLAQAYSAADVSVIPSRQDNLPNTIIESFACGTPVVGFRVGGIPDLVINGETGFCAKEVSSESLATTLLVALGTNGALRADCRRHAVARYSLHHQAKAYQALFDELYAERQRIVSDSVAG